MNFFSCMDFFPCMDAHVDIDFFLDVHELPCKISGLLLKKWLSYCKYFFLAWNSFSCMDFFSLHGCPRWYGFFLHGCPRTSMQNLRSVAQKMEVGTKKDTIVYLSILLLYVSYTSKPARRFHSIQFPRYRAERLSRAEK